LTYNVARRNRAAFPAIPSTSALTFPVSKHYFDAGKKTVQKALCRDKSTLMLKIYRLCNGLCRPEAPDRGEAGADKKKLFITIFK
jgi:hypothetical protein